MQTNDQLLEPKDEKDGRRVTVRLSRDGGLEELVKELTEGNKFVLTFPAEIRVNEDEQELCFYFSTNIGTEPHPGLHFSVSFDMKLPDLLKKRTAIDDLRTEILVAGGDPDEIIKPGMTEEQAKGILDGLQGAGA